MAHRTDQRRPYVKPELTKMVVAMPGYIILPGLAFAGVIVGAAVLGGIIGYLVAQIRQW